MINEIAEKIAALRKQKDLTLKELSEKSGLSISFLSQLENGSSSMAITSLKKIADALEVPINYFFSTLEDHNFHVPKDEQKTFRIEGSGAEYILLSGAFPDRTLETMVVTMLPGQDLGKKFAHNGEEFVYVLEGLLVVDLDGKQYIVKAGESMHYPSTMPHYWSNPLKEPTKLLSIITPALF